MDPRNGLWTDLIFPHCEPDALLTLRAVCRALRAQLNLAPAHVWHTLTMSNSRMRYDERLDGWQGVERALARERDTLANAERGCVTSGPVIAVDDASFIMLVGGRVVAFFPSSVRLFDAESGAALATLDAAVPPACGLVVCDRWVATCDVACGVLLLDCVAARVLCIVPPSATPPLLSVAGPHLSIESPYPCPLDIVHIAGHGDATAVRAVAHIALAANESHLTLCARGRQYVLWLRDRAALLLCDVATAQPLRQFVLPPGRRVAMWHVASDGHHIIARLDNAVEGIGVAFSISDWRLIQLPQLAVTLCRRGRVCGAMQCANTFVDVDSGAVLRGPAALSVVLADTSGALLWGDGAALQCGVTVFTSPGAIAHALPLAGAPVALRYGVAALTGGRIACLDCAPLIVSAFPPGALGGVAIAQLHAAVHEAAAVLREALLRYSGAVALAFNGGKDCCAVLELLYRVAPRELRQMVVVHFEDADEFPEVAAFVAATRRRYRLAGLVLVRGGVRAGLAAVMAQHPHLRAFVSGRRATDPYSESAHFTPSTPGWPQCMRVSPILRWPYHVVWAFLRVYGVAYPALYDAGFTSLGTRLATCRNPALRRADGSYAPAHELADEALERLSRRA